MAYKDTIHLHCPKCRNNLEQIKDKENSTFWTNEFILKCPVCGFWKYKDNHKLAGK
jgi:uncharacterized protein YbaR (Trm112 family)